MGTPHDFHAANTTTAMITLKRSPQPTPAATPGITLRKKPQIPAPTAPEPPPSASAAVKAMTDGLVAMSLAKRGLQVATIPSHARVRPAPMPPPCRCSTCLRIAATE